MRILSVDLDFLFTNQHKWKDLLDPQLTPEQYWQVVEWKIGDSWFDPDKESLSYLQEVLKTHCKNAEWVFIEDHDEIVEHLDTDSFVVNMDYHHDISYGNKNEELNLENWVLHAKKKGLISNYVWIHQEDSGMCYLSPIKYNHLTWRDHPINEHVEYDKVVICLSPHFTPFKHHDIYYRLQKLKQGDVVKKCGEEYGEV